MPITPTYPGVYIEEISSGVRTITPVATSITAFVGSAPRGPAKPTRVQSIADFERQFGALDGKHPMTYAVNHYFKHGGADAVIVRVTSAKAVYAKLDAGGIPLQADSKGVWGNNLRAHIDLRTSDREASEPKLFNLFLYDDGSKATEEFRNLSTDKDSPRYVKLVLEEESSLVRLQEGARLNGRPSASSPPPKGANWFQTDGSYSTAQGGEDGGLLTEADLRGDEEKKEGIYALEDTDLFNILCIPPIELEGDVEADTYVEAAVYCKKRRAMLLVDSPIGWNTVPAAEKGVDTVRKALGDVVPNAAMYFPRLRMADPLKEGRLGTFVPCGAIAGIFARTDVARGVWKAPAGIEAGFSGVKEFTVTMSDPENGRLNPLGLNCLRTFRVHGNVVWGSRTLAGADEMASDHKYVPIRRFTLFLEESLYRGTQWVVFEPNDEPLWAQIRLNVGAFMHDLFRQGAFQGRTPSEAYYVRCSSDTTTQSDINRGIVNIEVGFAPLKPAEFVIIKIQQIAGKIET